MNKNFEKVFAKAKSENRSCFVAFVTGMDPDYESSKKILIELSKKEKGIITGVKKGTPSLLNYLDQQKIKLGDKIEVIEIIEFDGSYSIKIN